MIAYALATSTLTDVVVAARPNTLWFIANKRGTVTVQVLPGGYSKSTEYGCNRY